MRDATYFRLRGWIPLPLYALTLLALDPSHPAPWELWVGGGLAIAGLALRAWARVHIGRSSDTRRLHARRLVTTGPYAVTRNPLYLGNVAIATGLATWIGAGLAAPILAIALVAHYTRVILAEERQLEAAFGEPYRAYRGATGRWLPIPRPGEQAVANLQRELRIGALALAAAALGLALRLWLHGVGVST
jgi:protein-S-isoprenylcysteine O-methyltransferase Ste14